MRYSDEKFYWTDQHGVGWPNDYLGPDSMTRWIIETSVGFTDVGLLRISSQQKIYSSKKSIAKSFSLTKVYSSKNL